MTSARALVRATASTVSGGIWYHSACMAWSFTNSARTGWNVPAPTCRVRVANSTPRARRRSSMASSKWSPAVGAAIAPGSRAYTVW